MNDFIRREDAIKAVLDNFPEMRTKEQAEHVFDEIPIAEVVTFCDVIDNCEECPKYGQTCDGDKR